MDFCMLDTKGKILLVKKYLDDLLYIINPKGKILLVKKYLDDLFFNNFYFI